MHTNTLPAVPANLTVDQAYGLAGDLLEARRLKHGTARMDATDDAAAAAAAAAGGKSFTQEDVNRLIGEAKSQAVAKFADYDDLKAKAEAGKTLEQRVAELDSSLASERLARVRLDVATKTEGLGASWADDLTGSTKDELEASAKRIAERIKGTGQTGQTGRARTRRTVTETGSASTQGLTKKELAVEALRSMSGRRSSDGD